MFRVHYKSADGSNFGADFPRLDEALSFAEGQPLGAQVVDSDGVMMKRRLSFSGGELVRYEVARNGCMVDVMKGAN